MKKSVTLILCLVTVGVGLWVMRSSQTLNSACTLSTKTGGGTGCVSGTPFFLLGIALCATGAVSLIVALLTLMRIKVLKPVRQEQPSIATLHELEVEFLRDVA
jgi:hypothetical protein